MDSIDFVIVGNGPQQDLLQEKIAHQGLQDNFHLPDRIHDMAPISQDLDIYIYASIHQGIPMSVLKAMP